MSRPPWEDDVPHPADNDEPVVKPAKAIEIVGQGHKSAYWRSSLTSTVDGTVARTPDNLTMILAFDPYWAGCLRLNEFDGKIRWARVPPEWRWSKVKVGDALQEEHQSIIHKFVLEAYKINFPFAWVWGAAIGAAHAQAFDPLKDYLRGIQWDGEPRTATFAWRYLGCEDKWSNVAGQKWLVSAVARGLEPACEVHQMITLQGPQGIGKTSAFRLLAGKDWFHTLRSIKGVDSLIELRGKWIVEIGEMNAFRGRDAGSYNAFLTTSEDNYRAPYARSSQPVPRRCVFGGTTNSVEHLTDSTGSRRFWVLPTEHIDYKAIERDRNQLWAEAVAQYREGMQWYPDAEMSVAMATNAERCRLADPWEDIIGEMVDGCCEHRAVASHGLCRWIANADIWQKLEMEGGKQNPAHAARISAIFQRLGWVRYRTCDKRGWIEPEDWAKEIKYG